MLKLYIPSDNKPLHDYYANRRAATVIKDKLDIATVHNGYVCIDKDLQSWGVLDEKHDFVPQSAYSFGGRVRTAPRAVSICKNTPYFDMDVVYCDGGRMFQFGHTLLEGLARIYPHMNKKYKNCKFVFANWGRKPIPAYAWKLLDMFGLKKSDIIVLEHTAQFRTVYVPEPDFEITSIASHEFADVFQKIMVAAPECGTYDKIYLSRTAAGARKTYGEEQIEYIFEQNGFKIVNPEQLPVEQQIGLMRNCKYLAGLAGSALHLSAAMQPGGTVIQLKRQTDKYDNLDVQYTIDRACGLNTILIWASIEPIKTEHSTNHPQLVGITPELLEFCHDMGFEFDPARADEIGARCRAEYDVAVPQYIRDEKILKFKKSIARGLSFWMPGRFRRRNVRNWILHKLGAK